MTRAKSPVIPKITRTSAFESPAALPFSTMVLLPFVLVLFGDVRCAAVRRRPRSGRTPVTSRGAPS